MTIILDKINNKYIVTVNYPKKLKLEDFTIKFSDYEKMAFWIGKEGDKHFKDQKVKTPEEAFR